MSFSKTEIFNLATSALLLSREINNADTDESNEARVLNLHWNIAFSSTLQELDLDSLSKPVTLEKIENNPDTNSPWAIIYYYPNNCAFLRRLQSRAVTDNKFTHIAKRTGIYNGFKAIYTNEDSAVAEIIPTDIDLKLLSPMAAMAVAYKLANLSAPLITGKGAKTLRESLSDTFKIYKTEAQEQDKLENFNFEEPYVRSEFVQERIS